MNAKRLLLVVGAILLIAGVVALLVPVSVSDGNGRQVGCGNAVAEDTSGAQSANDSGVGGIPILNQVVPHTDFVGLCDSAVSSRRSWSTDGEVFVGQGGGCRTIEPARKMVCRTPVSAMKRSVSQWSRALRYVAMGPAPRSDTLGGRDLVDAVAEPGEQFCGPLQQ